MIVDALLAFILSVPKQMLNVLSTFPNLIIPQGAFNFWYDMFDTLTYVFPVWSLVPILTISIGIKVVQIAYALILRVKKLFWAS